MGFIYKASKEIFISPLLNQMKKEVKEENKRYNKMLNMIDQNIELENSMRDKLPKIIEVHQPYDSIIHEHYFW